MADIILYFLVGLSLTLVALGFNKLKNFRVTLLWFFIWPLCIFFVILGFIGKARNEIMDSFDGDNHD